MPPEAMARAGSEAMPCAMGRMLSGAGAGSDLEQGASSRSGAQRSLQGSETMSRALARMLSGAVTGRREIGTMFPNDAFFGDRDPSEEGPSYMWQPLGVEISGCSHSVEAAASGRAPEMEVAIFEAGPHRSEGRPAQCSAREGAHGSGRSTGDAQAIGRSTVGDRDRVEGRQEAAADAVCCGGREEGAGARGPANAVLDASGGRQKRKRQHGTTHDKPR